MDCASYSQLISRYLDDALSEEERSGLRLHLSQCSSCRIKLARYRRLDERLRQMPCASAPPDCRWKVLDQAMSDQQEFRLAHRLPIASLAMASLAVASLLILSVMVPLVMGIAGAAPVDLVPHAGYATTSAVVEPASTDPASRSLAVAESSDTAALAGYLPPAVSVERVALRWDEAEDRPEYVEVIFVAPRGTRVRLERSVGQPQRAPDTHAGWGKAILVHGQVWLYASQTNSEGIQVVRLMRSSERGDLTSLEAEAPVDELVQFVDWLR
ncbi:MAG: zf-HC2 domain-containing protein [Chloroflexota bacterium]